MRASKPVERQLGRQGFLPVVAILIAAIPVSFAKGDVNELREKHFQNQSHFEVAEFECVWREFFSNYYEEGLGLTNDALAEFKKDDDKRDQIEKSIGPLAANAKQSIEDFIAGKIESERSLIKEVSKPVYKFVFTSGEIREVRYTDPFDSKIDAALKRGIGSFTGGDYQVIQLSKDGKTWVGLEPFPFPTATSAIAWTTSRLKLQSVRPPYWGDQSVNSNFNYPFNNGLDLFWADRDNNAYKILDWHNGDVSIVSRRLTDESVMLYATSRTQEFCIPDWIAICTSTGDAPVSDNDVAECAQSILTMSREPTTFPERLFPTCVIYFEGLQQQGEGWYPKKLLVGQTGKIRTSKNLFAFASHLPRGLVLCGELTIASVKCGAQVNARSKLEIPKGTNVLDLDPKFPAFGKE